MGVDVDENVELVIVKGRTFRIPKCMPKHTTHSSSFHGMSSWVFFVDLCSPVHTRGFGRFLLVKRWIQGQRQHVRKMLMLSLLALWYMPFALMVSGVRMFIAIEREIFEADLCSCFAGVTGWQMCVSIWIWEEKRRTRVVRTFVARRRLESCRSIEIRSKRMQVFVSKEKTKRYHRLYRKDQGDKETKRNWWEGESEVGRRQEHEGGSLHKCPIIQSLCSLCVEVYSGDDDELECVVEQVGEMYQVRHSCSG